MTENACVKKDQMRDMDIFLLRHFESVKNTQLSFSSLNDLEDLTAAGIEQGRQVAADIKMFIKMHSLTIKKIYCADSVRAKKSAELIAREVGPEVKVRAYTELLSTKSMDTVGRTKEEVRKVNPQFIQELSLYDAGLYNSYSFHRAVGKEEKRRSEQQVCQCIEEIINNKEQEDIKIICLHNSSITAAAINIARTFYDYPQDFYGKVIADNGKIFWIQKKNERLKFVAANCDSRMLLDNSIE